MDSLGVARDIDKMAEESRVWVAGSSIAWVQTGSRVVLIDLRDSNSVEPMVCPDPAARLWRALADGPCLQRDLLAVAADAVGEDAAAGLLDAFLVTFESRGLVVTTE